MAKQIAIPSIKRPTASIPVDAMAAFVSGATGEGASLVSESNASSANDGGTAAVQDGDTSAVRDDGTSTVVSMTGRPHVPRASRTTKRAGRRLETRRDGSVTRKVTVYLEPDLDKQLSLHAVTNDIDRSDVVAEALSRFLRRTA